MQPEERDAALLWDMLRYSTEAKNLVVGRSFQGFLDDPLVRLANERALEIVGEAANHVSPDFRSAHPQKSPGVTS